MQEIAMSILDIAYNSIRANASLIKILIHDSNNLNIINILYFFIASTNFTNKGAGLSGLDLSSG